MILYAVYDTEGTDTYYATKRQAMAAYKAIEHGELSKVQTVKITKNVLVSLANCEGGFVEASQLLDAK